MARPTKTPDQPRAKTAKFRVSVTEYSRLEQLAADAGMSISDYLRAKALDVEPVRPKATPQRAALIAALGPLGFIRADLGHVRADINQILKDRWAYKFVAPERVDAALADLAKAVVQIEAVGEVVLNRLDNDR